MIREANWADLPAISKLVRMHYDSTGFVTDVVYNEETLTQSLGALQYSDDSIMFVAVEYGVCIGVLALQIATTFFSRDRAARELFLYIRPEYRGRHAGVAMIKMGETWARSKGAQSIIIGNHPLSPPHVAETYIRHGYREAQTDFLKRLT
jgi:GNAT superfamily N-acetyltransferase